MLRCEFHMTRCGVESSAFAMWAHLLNQVINFGFGKTLLTAFLIVVSDGIVEYFALIFVQLYASAYALCAPTVLAVVTEQTRIEFVVRGAAHRACTQS